MPGGKGQGCSVLKNSNRIFSIAMSKSIAIARKQTHPTIILAFSLDFEVLPLLLPFLIFNKFRTERPCGGKGTGSILHLPGIFFLLSRKRLAPFPLADLLLV